MLHASRGIFKGLLQFRNATPAIFERSDSFQSTSGSFCSRRAHCQKLLETSDSCSVQNIPRVSRRSGPIDLQSVSTIPMMS